jgi:hypothetical protein
MAPKSNEHGSPVARTYLLTRKYSVVAATLWLSRCCFRNSDPPDGENLLERSGKTQYPLGDLRPSFAISHYSVRRF